MFSLIIVLVSIALVVLLVAATIYYGGSASANAQARTSAATLINQGSQINAAGTLAVSQGTGWPGASPAFGEPYLKSMPVPPKSAYADQSETPSSAHWTYYVDPADPSSAHHFVLKNKISAEVCMAVNRAQGVIGIPAVWDGTTLIQCFGAGVAAGAGKPLGYTFFYDPVGSTPAQDAVALDQSKTEGGSSTPGYPRLCPDASTITSGTCVDSASSGSTGIPATPPAAPGNYSVQANPGTLDLTGTAAWGDSYVNYCSGDAPAGAFTFDSVIMVAGATVPVVDVYDSMGQHCILGEGHPSAPAGAQGVYITNADGSTAEGTITYVEAFVQGPDVTGISQSEGNYDEVTTVTLTGAGFTPETQAFASAQSPLPAVYLDGEHIRVTIPKASEYGIQYFDYSISIDVRNPGTEFSGYATFTYKGPPPPPAPTLSSITPDKFAYYSAATASITGSNFMPGATAYFADTGENIPVTFIDASHIQLALPPGGVNEDALIVAGGPDREYTPQDAKNENLTMFWRYFDARGDQTPVSIAVSNPGSAPAYIDINYKPYYTVLKDSLQVDNNSLNDVGPGSSPSFCTAGNLLLGYGLARVDGSWANNTSGYSDGAGGSCAQIYIPNTVPPGPATLRIRVSNYYTPYPPEYNDTGGLWSNCPNCTELSATINIII